MHVAQLIARQEIGGSELVALEICEYLNQHNHQATLVGGPGALQPVAHQRKVTTLDWPLGEKRLSTLQYIRRLRRWFADAAVDVVHVHSRLPAWLAWLALRKMPAAGRPAFVTTVHGHYSVSRYSGVMLKGDRVIAVSQHIRDYVKQHYGQTDLSALITIENGIGREAFPWGHQPSQEWLEQRYREFPALRERAWLCLPGRITHWKGHLQFLDLLNGLLNQGTSVVGVFVGAGRTGSSFYHRLQEKIERLNLQQSLVLTGARTDMPDWMAASSIIYNLSAQPPEAFGRTVLEGLRLGKPVLGWDHGGAGEILRRIYPAGAIPLNDMQALSQQTLVLLDSPDTVPATDAFLLSNTLQKTLALYQELL